MCAVETLTNRSHLALFRYAVSHPYLFWISFSLPLSLFLFSALPPNLSAAFVSTKPHSEFTQEISKVEKKII